MSNKTPRNAPCPCGSGKKYKQCHLQSDQAEARKARLEAQRAAEADVPRPKIDPADLELPDNDAEQPPPKINPQLLVACLVLIGIGAVALIFTGYPRWGVAVGGCGVIITGIVWATLDPPKRRGDGSSAASINFGRD